MSRLPVGCRTSRQEPDKPSNRLSVKPSATSTDHAAQEGLARLPSQQPSTSTQPSSGLRPHLSKPTGLLASPRQSLRKPENTSRPGSPLFDTARSSGGIAGLSGKFSAQPRRSSSSRHRDASDVNSMAANGKPTTRRPPVDDATQPKPKDQDKPFAAPRSPFSCSDGPRPDLARRPLAAGPQARKVRKSSSGHVCGDVGKRQRSAAGPSPISSQPAPKRTRKEDSMPTEQLVKPSCTKAAQPRDACTTGGPKSQTRKGPAAAHAYGEPSRMPERHVKTAAGQRTPDKGQRHTALEGAQHELMPQTSTALGVKVEATASPQQDAQTSTEARKRSQQPEAPAATARIGTQLLPKLLATADQCAPHRSHLQAPDKCLAMHSNSSSMVRPRALQRSGVPIMG